MSLAVGKYELSCLLTLKCDWFHLALVMLRAAEGALYTADRLALTRLMQPAARAAAAPVCHLMISLEI